MTRSRHILSLAAAILALGAAIGCGGPARDAASLPPPEPRYVDPPAGPGAFAPNLSAWNGSVILSWLEPPGEGPEGEMALRFARLEGGAWSEARTIVSGSDFFANWADVPSVIREADGDLLAAWLRKSGEGTYAYDVELARSGDDGVAWERLGTPHEDRTPTEHGFVSLIPEGSGTRAFWLDGRETGATGGHGEGAMTLRTRRIGSGPEPSELLDPRVCDCCKTSAAITPAGPILAYRDRGETEIRDISILRRIPEGWTSPATIHDDGWEVPGCPVNGPALAARGAEVAAVWHTVEGGRARVLAAFSEDSGAAFGDPIEVDGEEPPGRVDAVIAEPGEAIVAWLARDADGAVVRLVRVDRAGRVGEALDLARSDAGRSSGFPKIALDGGSLVAAWTQPGERSRVRAAIVPLEALPAPGDPGATRAARPWDKEKGSRAPEFTGTALDGRTLSLSEFEGAPLLVNLWATWCAPCREEMPLLAELARARSARGLRVVGISLDASSLAGRVREIVEKEKLPYPVIMDSSDAAAERFGVSGLPATFLFDRRGALVWKRLGRLNEGDAEFDAAIEEALRR